MSANRIPYNPLLQLSYNEQTERANLIGKLFKTGRVPFRDPREERRVKPRTAHRNKTIITLYAPGSATVVRKDPRKRYATGTNKTAAFTP